MSAETLKLKSLKSDLFQVFSSELFQMLNSLYFIVLRIVVLNAPSEPWWMGMKIRVFLRQRPSFRHGHGYLSRARCGTQRESMFWDSHGWSTIALLILLCVIERLEHLKVECGRKGCLGL